MAHQRVSRRILLRALGTTVVAGAVTGLTTTPSTAAPLLTPKPGEDAAPFLTQFLSTAGTHALLSGQYTLDSAVVVPDTLRELEARRDGQDNGARQPPGPFEAGGGPTA